MMMGWGEAALVVLGLIAAMGAAGLEVAERKALIPLPDYARLLKIIAWSTFGLVSLSILEVLLAFIQSDFHYVVVILHSHTQTPLIYKISALWAHHEGSMLLWLWILVLYTVFAAHLTPQYWRGGTVQVLLVMIALMALYIVTLSSPFIVNGEPPTQGLDLNPLLQDPAVAIHPPLLYLGLVGFAVPFAVTLAALRREPNDLTMLASQLRNWVLAPWGFLTLGIALGSYWAYYELGWGGWWFWDPVENASLMPWLMGLALMHGLILLRKTHVMPRTTTALALGTFLVCLLGTFLVRSNLIASVHSFATDPVRGQGLLAFLGLMSAWAILIWARRAPSIQGLRIQSLLSRELGLAAMIVICLVLTFTVALGTLYPLILEGVSGLKITVGAPYFNAVFVPIAVLGLSLMIVGIHLPWQQGDWQHLKKRLKPAQAPTAVVLALLWGTYYDQSLALWALLGVSVLGFICNLIPLRKWQWWPPKSMSSLAHMASAALLGFASVDAFTSMTRDVVLAEGEATHVEGFDLRLERIERLRTPTYMAERYHLSASSSWSGGNLTPERRFYPAREVLTTEVALLTQGLSQLYVAATPPLPGGKRAFKVSTHPGILGLWIAATLMAMAAFLCMLKRKQMHREPAQ